MTQVVGIKEEVYDYISKNNGKVTSHDLYIHFNKDREAISFAMTLLDTEGKVEERKLSSTSGKRLFVVDEKLWRKI